MPRTPASSPPTLRILLRRSLVGALIASGCTERHRVEIQSGPDDLVIVASVGDGGALEVRSARGSELTVLPYEAGIVAWVLPFGSIVDELGAPRLSIEAGTVEAPPGSCGRCMVPGAKLLLSGDSCPLPSGLEPATLGEVDLAAVSARVRIGVPGPCACEPPLLASAAPFSVCPILPAEAPIRVDEVVLGDDGTVFGANEGYAIRIDPTGVASSAELRGYNRIYAPSILPDGTYLVAGRIPSIAHSAAGYALFDRAFQPISATGLPDFSTQDIAHLPGADFSMIGENANIFEGTVPSIVSCDADPPGAFQCRPELTVFEERCQGILDQPFVRATTTSSGVGVALAASAQLFFRAPGDDRWFCDAATETPRLVSIEGVEHAIFAGNDLGALGDRIFACFRLASTEGLERHGVFTATVAALTAADLESSRTYGVHLALTATITGGCGPFFEDGGGLAVMSVSSGEALRFDGAGRLVARYDGVGRGAGRLLFDGLPERMTSIQTRAGRALATSSSGFLYRRHTAAFEPVYAPTVIDELPALVASNGAEAVVFRTGRPPAIVSGTECTQIRVEEVTIPDLWQAGEIGTTALALADGRFAVALRRDDRAVIRIVDLEGARVDREVLAPDLAGHSITAGAEPSPGRLIWIAGPKILELGVELTELPIEHDDPSTPEVEAAPPLLAWHDLAAGRGVAWIAGTEALGRWTAGSATVEAFWLARASAGDFASVDRAGAPTLEAVHMRCPDDVVLAAKELVRKSPLSSPRKTNLVWWMTASICTAGDPLALCRFPGHDQSDPLIPDNDATAIGILAGAGAPTFIYSDGVVQRIGFQRTNLPFSDVADVTGSSGRISIGGPAGRAAIIVDR